ncbi:hypothetical protein KKF34_03565 [Myxococcota bacterium]|nr:hypothetical protein [Myxococcota bacterium]MBU1382789.1 hypothetical protein [Myxococcota bacterium]MBU1495935.1 hypothetical protein [Myxococcota bacterium]
MVGTDKNLRLAGRLLRVIERHANAHPSLGWIKESAEKNARDFINAAAVYSTSSIARLKERKEGLIALDELKVLLKGYIPMISSFYPLAEINITNITGNTPDDTLRFTERVLEVIQSQSNAADNQLVTEFITRVSASWEKALKEWTEYENADEELRNASKNLQSAKALFNTDLGIIRRTLAAVLGRTHADVRKLMISSSYTPDPEDPQTPPEP